MSKLNLIVIALISVSAACNRPMPVKQAKDKDITLEVSEIREKEADESLTYRARLIPSKELWANEGLDQKRLMNYKMDSCFYLEEGRNKNYAALVQAVANGVSGTYEYLLVFNADKRRKDSVNLVYQDRYINQKTYKLKLATPQ